MSMFCFVLIVQFLIQISDSYHAQIQSKSGSWTGGHALRPPI